MVRVALYVRVSTDMQELENQVNDLTKYAERQKHEVFRVYKDVMTGKSNSRPGFVQLFEDAHKRLFELVIFWDISRFSRSGTLYTLQKLKELENLGIAWESYQEQYLRSAGQFKDVAVSMMATVAKIEREKISDRTKSGMRMRKLQGVHCGRPKGSKDKKRRYRSCWKKASKRGYADVL